MPDHSAHDDHSKSLLAEHRTDDTFARWQHEYEVQLSSSDPIERAVAEAQLSILSPPLTKRGRRGAWSHVAVVELFAENGNTPTEHRPGVFRSGHEPVHGSRSGACVTIEADRGVWWCSSCDTGGDARGYLVDGLGMDEADAEEALTRRWGARTRRRGRRRLRLVSVEL